MRTSLLHDIESWAVKTALNIEEVQSTNTYVIVQVKNFSVTAFEINGLERIIRYWHKDAHWHSIDHITNGLEIWIAI